MKLDRFFMALTGAALSVVTLMLLGLVTVVVINGSKAFWPKDIHLFTLKDGSKVIGEIHESVESRAHPGTERHRIKTGNRDLYGLDFRWLESEDIKTSSEEASITVVERMEYGNFFAAEIDKKDNMLFMRDAEGRERTLKEEYVVREYQPNTLSVFSKLSIYGSKIIELLTEEPREANTEGGLYPAIFGTVLLIFVMSLASFPFGVIAAIYMREYAKDGWLLKMVRVAVNNLAGIPSIVFGIFGLGFFVYGIGGNLDQIFFSDQLPTPTFGTGGLLWASLTLGLLTVPVVIVSTEESLSVIPKGVREGALALGSSKLQTLVRVVIPMASPGILTGFILAMTRAAGEVAPLMITGVVKLAPELPLDGNFPFIHLGRKFMHLGFHIYDVGFQSPNVEAAKPMVYVTTLLLLCIVISLTSGAILLRKHLKNKFTTSHI
jgi:phosphate transport system permease protein